MDSVIWGILDCVVAEAWCLDRPALNRLVQVVSFGV